MLTVCLSNNNYIYRVHASNNVGYSQIPNTVIMIQSLLYTLYIVTNIFFINDQNSLSSSQIKIVAFVLLSLHFIDKGDTSIHHHELYISPTKRHFLVLHNICDTIMYNCHSISSPHCPYMFCNILHNFHHYFPVVFSFLFPSPFLYSACFFLF